MIGVNHYDPFHRSLLEERFGELRAAYGEEPAFVANEVTEEALKVIVPQRPWLREAARSDWPMLDDATLDMLAMSLGFDGDSHDEFFGHERAHWLGYAGDFSTYAAHRVKRCHQFVDYQGMPIDGADFSRKLSIGCHELGGCRSSDAKSTGPYS